MTDLTFRRMADVIFAFQEELERRYELIAEHGDTRVMLCYSARLGRRAINETCLRRAYNLAALIGVPADDLRITFLKPAARGAIVNDWSIRFSGRTQRDAVSNGELPWIGDAETISKLALD